ncbi:histidinol-phosphate transaminase [Microbacterium sp. EYE_5]|uniref:histidinol-phosphate transaminase n=1 Tax=unclassified Microbacterium TaxID=2609290 RepID=UPI0020046CB3|nr:MULTISPECIES: histidinol-phosphate transaminase [unclassified Microbacterium]MCK6079487.1 histidinol-phosphate transaminase [Microbacterium sp. EYE_382]MCK6084757.1 histidinol-phosphate transaminase [Microbacterium sp. EYE_384]MCK6123016.1 histidinol-phosphate transaminase [Microbacterium sp. EYE_80]MCK6125521.1 histidinol-phosphate transaminase [Microbacterium sp. EYE_79]MCK6140441.1 histidinol-phosphate transaminase [Microbacterium sp. EYE_39]
MTDMPVRVRPEIAALPAYKQGKQAGPAAYKLSSNENPFDPLPGVVSAVRDAVTFNRYPDALAARLRSRLADRFGVADDRIHIAAGSVSILYQLAQAAASVGDEIVVPWRSFEAYPGIVTVTGATPVMVPLTDAAANDLPTIAAAVTDRTRMVLVCTPNNPTGAVVSQQDFDAFVAAVPSDVLIVLDEAYAEFVTDPAAVNGETVVAAGHDNVVLLRTFSKAYGLAGLRIGYAVGHPRILDAARSAGIPLSVTAQAEAAALASLDAEDELRERVAVVAERRDRLVARLREIGWDVPIAQGNFVWLPAGDRSLEVAAAFEAADLVVRPFAGDGVRISVGEEESLDRVVEVAATVRG